VLRLYGYSSSGTFTRTPHSYPIARARRGVLGSCQREGLSTTFSDISTEVRLYLWPIVIINFRNEKRGRLNSTNRCKLPPIDHEPALISVHMGGQGEKAPPLELENFIKNNIISWLSRPWFVDYNLKNALVLPLWKSLCVGPCTSGTMKK